MSIQDLRREFPVREELIADIFTILRGSDPKIYTQDLLSSFFALVIDNGFPATVGGAEAGGLKAKGLDTKQILDILEKSGLLFKNEITGKLIKDSVKRTGDENAQIQSQKDKRFDVWMLSQKFLNDFKAILPEVERAQGVTLTKLKEAKEEIKKIRRMMRESLVEEKGGTDKEAEFFKKMDDEVIEIFIDALLISLAELELSGVIPKFEKATDIRDALLAAIRKMYRERGIIAKMSRKFNRLGSNRVLRYARADINKAIRGG